MIHQIPVPLHQLTDLRNRDTIAIALLSKRHIVVGDFLCFECNDARFPKNMKRWLYAEVTITQKIARQIGKNVCGGFVMVSFDLVQNLSDVTVN